MLIKQDFRFQNHAGSQPIATTQISRSDLLNKGSGFQHHFYPEVSCANTTVLKIYITGHNGLKVWFAFFSDESREFKP